MNGVAAFEAPRGPASGAEHPLDAFHYFVMLQKIAPTGGSTTLFHGLEEPVIFKRPVHCFLDYLRGFLIFANCDTATLFHPNLVTEPRRQDRLGYSHFTNFWTLQFLISAT